ncbi:MAG: RsmE family RNA methyltransferase [Candidatus Absconditabacteria bacterium]
MAQLFITPYEKSGNTITITNPEIIDQCRKVLRLAVGKEISLQNTHGDSSTRHTITITEIKQHIKGTITEEKITSKPTQTTIMAVAMPNKRDKIELIVQKLAEIGIDQIIFWPSERSIIKEWNAKKAERVSKIAKEATEQSRNRFMPEIKFSNTPILSDTTEYVIFDKTEGSDQQFHKNPSAPLICGIVGPEGGLSSKDHQLRAHTKHHVQQLGSGVLRTETGAIIGGWLIKNA